jgi:hypothetical protein
LRKANRGYKRKIFFSRYRAALIAGVSAFIVIAGITGNMIYTALNRFNTGGLTPEEVVATYYEALDNLDIEIMEGCVRLKDKNTMARNDISMVSNLHVISKVRQSYESRNVLISAKEYLQDDSIEVGDRLVFGIGNINAITMIAVDSAAAKIACDYTFVAPNAETGADVESTDRSPLIVRRVDTLVLKLVKNAWVIESILREEF